MPPSVSVLCTVHQDGWSSQGNKADPAMWRLQRAMLRNLTSLHGHAVHLDLQVAARGLKHSMLSITPAQDASAMILLEDDLEVSPLLFAYAAAFASRYSAQATNATTKTPTVLLGVNLFTDKADYMTRYPPRPLHLPTGPLATGVPSSWGALYLGKSFERFQDWVVYEHGVDNQVSLPSALRGASQWPSKNSWKKYLVSYMLSHEAYMLTVNFNRGSLVSNQAVRGVHTSQGVVDSTRWAMQPYPLLRLQDLQQLRQEGLDPSAVCSSSRFEQSSLDVYDAAWVKRVAFVGGATQ